MGDALKKVGVGDKLRIPAAAYNAFIDTAVAHQRQRQQVTGGASVEHRRTDIVKVKNTSVADCPRFGVLGIDEGGVVITPAANLQNFQNEVALKGVIPQVTVHTGRFAIALEPIKAGAFGLAVVSGVCIAKVDVQAEDHRCADVSDGVINMLRSMPIGGAQILWKESGTGELWAVVRLGRAPAPGEMFAVQVEVDGGYAGDKVSPCTYTYTVTDLAGWGLGEYLIPEKARPSRGKLVGGSATGVGYYDVNANFVLYDANETLDTEAC